MNNIFSFPKSEELQDKIIVRLAKIAAVVFVCFIASLFVRLVINDRIDRGDRAVDDLVGLYEVKYNPVIEFRNLNGEDVDTLPSSFFFDDVSVKVTERGSKTLGKQELVTYKADIVSRGTIQLNDFSNSDEAARGIRQYMIRIPEGADESSVGLKVDDIDFKSFALTQDNRWIKINANKIKIDSKLELNYTVDGVASINFIGANYDNKYKVEINPGTDNIRIINASNGNYNKETGIVRISVNSYDEESGIKFLSSFDDIVFVDRIVKYAILFIIIVFSFAFYFDLRKKLIVSMLQYLLVGVSLALFYLLVLALGEQIGYLQSYIAASVATGLLNAWYISEVFRSKKIGAAFGIILVALYAILYYLIQVAEINLLLGTILLYIILVLFMLGSKNINKVG